MCAVLGESAVGGGGPGPVQSQGRPARQGNRVVNGSDFADPKLRYVWPSDPHFFKNSDSNFKLRMRIWQNQISINIEIFCSSSVRIHICIFTLVGTGSEFLKAVYRKFYCKILYSTFYQGCEPEQTARGVSGLFAVTPSSTCTIAPYSLFLYQYLQVRIIRRYFKKSFIAK